MPSTCWKSRWAAEADGEWERRFLAAVKLVSRIRVITHPRARLAVLGQARTESQYRRAAPPALPRRRYQVVAIGASTGGPGAMVQILRALPSAVPAADPDSCCTSPNRSVPHSPNGSTARRRCEWRYARTGDALSTKNGQVTMAPADAHLVIRGGRLHLTQEPPRHSCRPSVDMLFESVACEYGAGRDRRPSDRHGT